MRPAPTLSIVARPDLQRRCRPKLPTDYSPFLASYDERALIGRRCSLDESVLFNFCSGSTNKGGWGMFDSAVVSSHGTFTPDDLTMLKDVFNEICKANGTEPDSPSASQLARALIAAFESGSRTKEVLLALIASPTRCVG